MNPPTKKKKRKKKKRKRKTTTPQAVTNYTTCTPTQRKEDEYGIHAGSWRLGGLLRILNKYEGLTCKSREVVQYLLLGIFLSTHHFPNIALWRRVLYAQKKEKIRKKTPLCLQ
jgi:hypothetical protein